MKVKVIKNTLIPKGFIFKIEEPARSSFVGVCEELDEERLQMAHNGCSFRKGQIVESGPSMIKQFGPAFFKRCFEILEGGPQIEAPTEEPQPGDDLAEAMISLMEANKVSPKTGMPSCKGISAILDRDVSSKERDAMFLELEENK